MYISYYNADNLFTNSERVISQKDERGKKKSTFEMERRILLMCLYILDSLQHINREGTRLILCNCIPNFTISQC